ncbi:ribosome biogenesis protein [Niveomyces insectorum RCEF 264]|uniref:Ribosome biogenesis protein n=1 Tax=Niveomyces insectorum RCEF 264 TaxID=1081102 RepID=A0A167NAH4_9HYPO|nr:ribosome biogenesis protein [Niveomyces insectorum RCEF 264]
MAKRHAPDGEGPRKRPRIVHEAPTSEEIHSARQLMQLLAFDQDVERARHGLQSFKLLLDRLNDPETHTTQDAELLQNYLEATKPRKDRGDDGDGDDEGEGEADPVYLPDVMDTWDLAAKFNSDNLMSAVPVVLALLLKYLSHVLPLAPVGLGLCRTLLRRRPLELLARNLSADKGKEFVISPTLRLLREVVSFDGGAVAKAVFRARNFTYRSLARNMSIRFLGDGVEDGKRTSARTNAVRFVLASLTFLHPEAKAELLAQRELVQALFRTVRDDPPYLVHDILDTVRNHVLKDKKLPRSARSKLLNAGTLTRIAGLYSYAHEGAAAAAAAATATATTGSGSSSNKLPVSDAAHQFLLDVCTSPTVGVLRPQNGCYPQGVEPDTAPLAATTEPDNDDDDDAQTDVGLDRIVWIDKFTDEIPVFNFVLADFVPCLRPWSSTRQSELLLAIFRAAPELVAWYYINKKNFTFEPKISATWVGFAALLFNTIEVVDLPPYFGRGSKATYARIPPPTSVVVDNILPLPLTQKIMTRCLAHKSKLVPFFAMRLLALSMAKLRRALHMHEEAARMYPREALWRASARRVVDEFCRRCPLMRDVINAYRACGADDLLFREASSRVLRLYYEVVPQMALLSKFDVSSSLFAVMRQVEEHDGLASSSPSSSSQDKALKLMELEHLLAIAGYSPGMQWFSKAKGLAASPFTALLKVYTEAQADLALDEIADVLDFVAQEQQLVLPGPASAIRRTAGLAALFGSLATEPGAKASSASLLSDPVWAFVDNCIVRCANAPIKYIEMLQGVAVGFDDDDTTAVDTQAVDPITMAMAEQLHFATENASDDALDKLGSFLLRYLTSCTGSKAALQPIVDKVLVAFPSKSKATAKLAKGLAKQQQARGAHKRQPPLGSARAKEINGVNEDDVDARADKTADDEAAEESSTAEFRDTSTLEALLDVPPVPALDTAILSKWANKPADELVEEGHAAALIMLLVSDDDSVRRQALVNLVRLAAKIREASTYDEKDQVWLLLSELVATAKAWMTDAATARAPLPSHLAAFACHALDVLRNPLHALYAKVNAFLTAGPVWRTHARAFPLVHDIVRDGPTEDDTYYGEIHWLLAYLLDSLRTPADVGVFRTRRLFETLLSVASNPYMRAPLRRQVLRILARAASIDGGSTTLITRSGVVSWLVARTAGTRTRTVATPRPRNHSGAQRHTSGHNGSRSEGADENERQDDHEDDEARVVRALLQRLWSTCDQERVDNWSMHGVQESIHNLGSGVGDIEARQKAGVCT